jgi:hypothetical protein
VDASGHYVLCGVGELMSELVIGAVGPNRLEDVWREDQTLQEFRAGLPSWLGDRAGDWKKGG